MFLDPCFEWILTDSGTPLSHFLGQRSGGECRVHQGSNQQSAQTDATEPGFIFLKMEMVFGDGHVGIIHTHTHICDVDGSIVLE